MAITAGSTRSYKIKKTDSALTVPGRSTFPKGTFVAKPPAVTKPQDRLPYAMSTGTGASGLSGSLGAPAAMYPSAPGVNNYLGIKSPVLAPSVPARTTPFQGVPAAFYQSPVATTGQQLAQQWQQQNNRQYGTDDSWYRPVAPANNIVKPPAQTLAPGQFMNAQGIVQQGATPFGVNAFGERLDVSGNVWDPATATTDIYGGRFIQEGSVTWERNRQGRLIKVKHLGGGQTRVVAGGKGGAKRRAAARAAAAEAAQVAQPVQQVAGNLAPEQSASAFVSFRA